jgi:acetylornithine deacetylase/succinyl-diaminopimelate desuccinylase family protein
VSSFVGEEAIAALAEAARGAVDVEAVVPLAQRLIRTFTENPPGATRAACDVLAAELFADGFELEVFEPAHGHASLIATHAFDQPGRTIAFNGHVDVVPVTEGWTRDPLGGEVEEGRLYGRGAVDMKGAVAAMTVAARSLVRSGLPLRGRIVLMAVADEEQGGGRGSGALVEAGKVDADAVVIGEPSAGTVVIAHRATCFVEVRTYGRAGHASMPEHAVNAVESMLDALSALRSVELAHLPDPVLGSPSVSIGTTIAGGHKVNVVPDRCVATLDVRMVPGMTPEGVLDDFHAALAQAGLESPTQVELEVLMAGETAVLDPESELARRAADALGRELGRPAALGGMSAATDGWWFANRAGIPTIVGLGPGSIRDCHVADESVDVAELEAYARVYADLAASFLAAPHP